MTIRSATNRIALASAAILAGLLVTGTTASAAPLPASPTLGGDEAGIVRVGGGCPFGLVPDYYGGCRRPFRRAPFGYGAYGGYGGGYYGYRPYYRPRPYYNPYY